MKRRLTTDERALWDHVTANIQPRRRRAPAQASSETLPATPVPKPASRRKTVLVKPVPAPDPLKTKLTPAADPFAAPRLDGRRSERFLKGEIEIEGRIDLHGLTLDMAHKALAGFLMQARVRGHRMVLVITGKGAGKGGALKRLVPMWLGEPPFGGMIAGLAQARQKHGGEGALYLYLRRQRES